MTTLSKAFRILVLAVFFSCALSYAETGNIPSAPPEQPLSAVEGDLRQVIDSVGKKLRAGPVSAAILADDLKQFDVLLEKYKDQRTDEAAQILVLKAMVYLEVLGDFENGISHLKQLQVSFPDSRFASQVPEMLGEIERMKNRTTAEATPLAIGSSFPLFSETDIDGKPLNLADFRGKIVLIDFWATWCGPCVTELPHVLAAYQKYHEKGFEIIGISLDKKRDRLDAFLTEHKMTWPQYFDGLGWDNKLSTSYNIRSIPATYLLDREGKIIASNLRGDDLERLLAELIK